MPTGETHIAARDSEGVEIYFHQSTLPTADVISAYEKFHQGAAGEMLAMAHEEQTVALGVRDRDSRLEFVTRVAGMCFAFTLTLVLLLGGIYLIATDHPIGGYSSMVVAIIGIIGGIAAGGRRMSGKQQ